MADKTMGSGLFFFGRVIDNKDPTENGRYKIRAYGFSDDETNIPDDNLPWGKTVSPVTSAALQGTGTSPTGMLPNTSVYGFWLDKNKTMPLILGSIPGAAANSQDTSSSGGTEVDPSTENDVNKLVRTTATQGGTDDTYTNLIQSGVQKHTAAMLPAQTYSQKVTYPDGWVHKTHANIEFFINSTQGSEAIRITHPKGSFFEIDKDGKMMTRAVGSSHSAADTDTTFSGKGNSTNKLAGNKTSEIGGSETKTVTSDITTTSSKGNITSSASEGTMAMNSKSGTSVVSEAGAISMTSGTGSMTASANASADISSSGSSGNSTMTLDPTGIITALAQKTLEMTGGEASLSLSSNGLSIGIPGMGISLDPTAGLTAAMGQMSMAMSAVTGMSMTLPTASLSLSISTGGISLAGTSLTFNGSPLVAQSAVGDIVSNAVSTMIVVANSTVNGYITSSDFSKLAGLPSSLSGYVTNSYMQGLSYVTSTQLTNNLANYVNTTHLSSNLALYVTNAYMQAQGYLDAADLSGYVTNVYMQGLAYVNSAQLAANLSNYVNTTHLSSNLALYVTNAYMQGLAYVNSAQLTANLANYTNTTHLSANLANYTTTASLAANYPNNTHLAANLANYTTTTLLNTNYPNNTHLSANIATREPTITAGTTGQYWRGDKSWQTLNKSAVGLGNVDNTSDANKPVSTATQTALDLKANSASPILTGTVSVGSNVTVNTTAFKVGNATVNTVITQSTIDVDGTITATSFVGNGALLTTINSTALTGTIDDARLPTTMASKSLASPLITTPTINGLAYVKVPDAASGANLGGVSTLQVYQPNTTSGDAFITFHLPTRHALHFGLDDSTDDLFVGGWSKGANKYKIWHAGNDGAASGLDADLLDGQHGSYYTNATNLTGTIPSARISGSYTGITSLSVGSNVVVNTSLVSVGNSTVNAFINSTSFVLMGNAGGQIMHAYTGGGYTRLEMGGETGAFIDLKSPTSDDYDFRMITTGTTGSLLSTGNIHIQPTGSLIVSTQASFGGNVSVTGTVTGTAFSGNGALLTTVNATALTGTIADARITGAYTGLTSLSIGSNVVANATTIRIGNATVNATITSSLIDIDGNVSATYLIGNGALLTSINVASLSGVDADTLDGQHGSYYTNATNISTGTLADARLPTTMVSKTLTTPTITGTAVFNGSIYSTNATTSALILMSSGNAATGVAGTLYYDETGTQRFRFAYNNPDGNYYISRYNTSGVFQDHPIYINGTSGLVAVSNGISVTGTVTGTAFSGNGALLTTVNATALTGTIPDARITGAYTGLTSLSVGSNVVVNSTMMFIGNSTVNTSISQLAITSDGTITGNLFSGNGASLTSIPASQLTGTIPDARISGAYTGLTSLSVGSNVVVNTSVLFIGNSTVNTTINSTAIDVDGSVVATLLVGALNSSNLTGTIADARISGAYTGLTSLSVGSNVVVNTSVFKVGNSTVNTVITQSTIDVDGTITGTTLVGALNSSNLTGTIPDARITGAYTGLTSLSVGSNVVVNTTMLFIGNSTVNTVITSSLVSAANISLKTSSRPYLMVGSSNASYDAGVKYYNSSDVLRWTQYIYNPNENYYISRYDAAGLYVDNPFAITATSGVGVFSNGVSVTGTVTATTFSGSGASLTSIPADQLTGTIADARISGSYTGITSLSVGSNVVVNTTMLFIGNSTINTAINSTAIAVDGNVSATYFVGNGAVLTTINATNISTGTLADARLPTTMASKTLTTPFFNGLGYYTVPDAVLGSNTGSVGTLQIYQANTTTGDAFMTFHNSNRFATHFGLDDATDDLFVGGWSKGANKYKIWHAGNDGAGSTLDADLLDGQQGAYYTNATNISTGTLDDARLPATITGKTVSSNTTFNDQVFVGTDKYVRFSGNGGIYWTTHGGGWVMQDTTWIRAFANKSIYTGGTVRADTSVLVGASGVSITPSSATFSGTVTGTTFSGSGASLTALNASELTSGTVPNARISGDYSGIVNLTASRFLLGSSGIDGDWSSTILDVKTQDNFRVREATSGFNRTAASGVVAYFNDNDTDTTGTIIQLRQSNSAIGSISYSSGTVSYNAFRGNHWSQLGSEATIPNEISFDQYGEYVRPSIPYGTVVEVVDELCTWSDGFSEDRLVRFKISDTPDCKSVYGTFTCWDIDGDAEISSVGLGHCRISASANVSIGDLLVSNGDGTAKIQEDDIVRSKTIGKVVSTIRAFEYEDGSYVIPTVLYCG